MGPYRLFLSPKKHRRHDHIGRAACKQGKDVWADSVSPSGRHPPLAQGRRVYAACGLRQLKFLLPHFFLKKALAAQRLPSTPPGGIRRPPPLTQGRQGRGQVLHCLKSMPLRFFFAYFLFFKKKVGQGVRRARSFAKLSPVSAENFKSSSSMVSFCFSSPEISKMILPACIMMSRLP